MTVFCYLANAFGTCSLVKLAKRYAQNYVNAPSRI